jgi:chitin synthase
MIHDKKLIGVCGETSLANAKQSLITMMQVYEYFISHHMAKAFESLFGSVTCLPGCFTLYRLRTPDTHKPLFISNQLLHDYSENRVDTLHMKNLLHLGEDRYLTTLLLKHFPTYKTQFVRDAHAYTVAPDDWKVLLSQRRRWINSTVHNLGELAFLDQLCGFCCFSMRFVVMIDLVSTIIQPITVGYVSLLKICVSFPADGTVDRVPGLSRSWGAQEHPDCFPHPYCRGVWFTGPSVRSPSQMGHDRMDGVLHPRYPCLLVPLTVVFVLEDGRLLMGCYSSRVR